ncbi:peptidoglycan DD-metalloendopeptidase family protein [Sporosarcina sp. ANT_H38]|uniref:peptidoglycan DD-metalloendopeptidase family protein n=1 Tax=Sporosarcina sp. ANT_H38 TaxID=2597358 RepID=UPI0011F346B6|nr:peptidoglycan DD-metalloendopeptidase family protein [Sporosarcina sp. ANT_H38]KAA0955513.1 peptidoglycan DD-metalloendopeptidase family protein [Sporosarcina sp. ANT_H38]
MFSKPCDGRVTSPFGYRIHPISHLRAMHWGVDYANTSSNNTIVAAAAGNVTFAKSKNGYGNTVMIVHSIGGQTFETVYAHLQSFGVKVGQTVKQGEPIGVKGSTGKSTGIHLHFELHTGRWNNKFTNAVDPLHYVVDPKVKQLQSLLVKAGYKIAMDGLNGPATTSAVKSFQQASGLVVDGIIGKLTTAALEKIAKGKVVQVSNPKSEVQ